MAARNPQTMAKRAREQAVKERRERKREKKAQRAADKLSGPVADEQAWLESAEPDSSQATPE